MRWTDKFKAMTWKCIKKEIDRDWGILLLNDPLTEGFTDIHWRSCQSCSYLQTILLLDSAL